MGDDCTFVAAKWRCDRMESPEPIPNAECTLCDHNLDHFALSVSPHPRIPVPVCLLCLEDVTEKFLDEDNAEEQCSWCGDIDRGVLFICGDGSSCGHSFCRDCLERNLGADFVSNIDDEENWLCIVCDPRQVSGLTVALEACVARSMYTLKFGDQSQDSRKEDAEGALESTEDDLEDDAARLRVVLEEAAISSRNLEPHAVELKKEAIHKELSASNSSHDIR